MKSDSAVVQQIRSGMLSSVHASQMNAMSCEEIHDNTQEVDTFPWAVIPGDISKI